MNVDFSSFRQCYLIDLIWLRLTQDDEFVQANNIAIPYLANPTKGADVGGALSLHYAGLLGALQSGTASIAIAAAAGQRWGQYDILRLGDDGEFDLSALSWETVLDLAVHTGEVIDARCTATRALLDKLAAGNEAADYLVRAWSEANNELSEQSRIETLRIIHGRSAGSKLN